MTQYQYAKTEEEADRAAEIATKFMDIIASDARDAEDNEKVDIDIGLASMQTGLLSMIGASFCDNHAEFALLDFAYSAITVWRIMRGEVPQEGEPEEKVCGAVAELFISAAEAERMTIDQIMACLASVCGYVIAHSTEPTRADADQEMIGMFASQILEALQLSRQQHDESVAALPTTAKH